MPLVGISERYNSFKSWNTYTSERKIHNHYFNTYYSEHNISYNRFYISYSNRNISVERELIKSERNISSSSYKIYNNDKYISLKYINKSANERNLSLSNVIEPITTEYTDERKITSNYYTIINNDRYISIEIFYCTERKIYTIPKNPTFKVDQRFCLMYLDKILFSEKYISFNAYSAKFSFKINDISNKYLELNINDNEYNLYTKKIYPDNLMSKFLIASINTVSHSTNDIFIIYEKNTDEYESINLAIKVNNKIKPKIVTNDYLIEGFILYRSSPIYIKFGYLLRKYKLNEDNLTENDILYKINRQNLMIIKINEREFDINEMELLYEPPYKPYTFYLYIEQSIKKYIQYISIDWYYPFKKKTKRNSSLLKII